MSYNSIKTDFKNFEQVIYKGDVISYNTGNELRKGIYIGNREVVYFYPCNEPSRIYIREIIQTRIEEFLNRDPDAIIQIERHHLSTKFYSSDMICERARCYVGHYWRVEKGFDPVNSFIQWVFNGLDIVNNQTPANFLNQKEKNSAFYKCTLIGGTLGFCFFGIPGAIFGGGLSAYVFNQVENKK